MEHKVEHIEWIDSRGVNYQWDTKTGLMLECCNCVSIGFVVNEDAQTVSIASHMCVENDSDHQYCGVMTIPKVAIKARRELE